MNAAYERYLNDEAFRAALHTNARRERARQVARVLAWAFNALKPRPGAGRPSRWLAVHGR